MGKHTLLILTCLLIMSSVTHAQVPSVGEGNAIRVDCWKCGNVPAPHNCPYLNNYDTDNNPWKNRNNKPVRTVRDDAEDIFWEAEKYYARGDYRRAADLYLRATQVDPSYGKAHNNYGNCLSKLGYYEQALEAFRMAMKTGGSTHAAENYRGTKAYIDSMKAHQEAINRQAEQQRLLNECDENERQADLLLQNGYLDKAFALLKENTVLDPCYYTYNQLGVALYRNNYLDESLSAFEKASSFEPTDAGGIKNIMLATNAISEKKEAEKKEKEEREENERLRQEKIKQQQAKLKQNRQNIKEANARINGIMDNLTNVFDSPVNRTGASGVLLPETGTHNSSVVDLSFISPDNQKIVDPRVVKGRMSPEEAAQERERVEKIGIVLSVAEKDFRNGNYDTAYTFFKNAAGLDPGNEFLEKLVHQAAYFRDRRKQHAGESRKVSILLDSLVYGKGDWGKSMKYLKEAQKAAPHDPQVRDAYHFVNGLSEQGDFNDWEYIPKQIPVTPYAGLGFETDILLSASFYCDFEGDRQGAFELMKEASLYNPDNPDIRDMASFLEGKYAARYK